MADYFEAGNQNENANGGAPAAAAGGDATMDDEILVSPTQLLDMGGSTNMCNSKRIVLMAMGTTTTDCLGTWVEVVVDGSVRGFLSII